MEIIPIGTDQALVVDLLLQFLKQFLLTDWRFAHKLTLLAISKLFKACVVYLFFRGIYIVPCFIKGIEKLPNYLTILLSTERV